MAVWVSAPTYLDAAAGHALGVVVRSCQQRYEHHSVCIQGTAAVLNVVHGRPLHGFVVLRTSPVVGGIVAPCAVAHDDACTKQECIHIICQHRIDPPRAVHPGELRLGFGRRRPVCIAEGVEHRAKLLLDGMRTRVHGDIALDFGPSRSVQHKDRANGQLEQARESKKERTQRGVLSALCLSRMIQPECGIHTQAKSTWSICVAVPVLSSELGKRAVRPGGGQLVPQAGDAHTSGGVGGEGGGASAAVQAAAGWKRGAWMRTEVHVYRACMCRVGDASATVLRRTIPGCMQVYPPIGKAMRFRPFPGRGGARRASPRECRRRPATECLQSAARAWREDPRAVPGAPASSAAV